MKKQIKLKFAANLVPLVLNGKKNTTWRINDEKEINKGDELIMYMTGENQPLARLLVTDVWTKPFKEFTEKEKAGHERFKDDEEMVNQYKDYYGDWVNFDTAVKIIKFKLLPQP